MNFFFCNNPPTKFINGTNISVALAVNGYAVYGFESILKDPLVHPIFVVILDLKFKVFVLVT